MGLYLPYGLNVIKNASRQGLCLDTKFRDRPAYTCIVFDHSRVPIGLQLCRVARVLDVHSITQMTQVKLPSAARLRAAKMKALRLAALQKDPQAPPSDPQMHLKSGAAKEAITMDSAVKFVPMILSFHKITYEVKI